MMQILSGAGIGFVVGATLMFVAIGWAAHHARSEVERRRDANLDRLRVISARRYFGQIANRNSLNEARKIANKALAEIE